MASKLLVYSSITLVILLSALAWFLALGGTAATQNTGILDADHVGMAWWTIWFNCFVYILLISFALYSRVKGSYLMMRTSKMFLFLVTILTVLCMLVSDEYIITTAHYPGDSSLSALQAASCGFVLMSVQNVIVGLALTFYSDSDKSYPDTMPMSYNVDSSGPVAPSAPVSIQIK
jgi:membrane-associated HD superfamily phosphohydrolase